MRGVEQIVLGTVQLGTAYGRRAGLPTPDEASAVAVLDEAWSLGVRAFDTAEAYGPAAARLAAWLRRRGRIADSMVSTKVTVLVDLESACEKFRGASALTLLTHESIDAEAFQRVRAFGKAQGIDVGQSVYTCAEVAEAAASGVDRVQAPCHVLDSAPLSAAHALGVNFDARSVFLQGVLVDEPHIAERRAPGLGVAAEAVARSAAEAGLSPAAALLATIMERLLPDDRVVVGFDAPDQLACIGEAVAAPQACIDAFVSQLTESRLQVKRCRLDPRTWGQSS